MPRKIKMPMDDSDEDDDGPMPDWKRKKNLEKLQKLEVDFVFYELFVFIIAGKNLREYSN